MHLDQLIEEYQMTDDEQVKDELFKQFTDQLWKSKYRLTKYKKKYNFKINEKALNYREDLIELFKKYQNIECDFVRSSFYYKLIPPIDTIRITINNLYAIYFDKESYYDKKYYELLKVPKKKYYETISGLKNGIEINFEEIKNKIETSLKQSEIIKQKSINRKLDLSWSEYKKLINGFLRKTFDNYIPIEQYEKKHGWELNVSIDGWDDDHFTVRYFCKSLSGYLRDYKRNCLGFKKNDKLKSCDVCGKLFKVVGRNHRMCKDCSIKKQKEKNREYARESMRRKRENKCGYSDY